MSEPREWILRFNDTYSGSRSKYNFIQSGSNIEGNDITISVIEKSAYDQLKAEYEQLRAALESITYETGCHIGCLERGTLETRFPHTTVIQAVDSIARKALEQEKK